MFSELRMPIVVTTERKVERKSESKSERKVERKSYEQSDMVAIVCHEQRLVGVIARIRDIAHKFAASPDVYKLKTECDQLIANGNVAHSGFVDATAIRCLGNLPTLLKFICRQFTLSNKFERIDEILNEVQDILMSTFDYSEDNDLLFIRINVLGTEKHQSDSFISGPAHVFYFMEDFTFDATADDATADDISMLIENVIALDFGVEANDEVDDKANYRLNDDFVDDAEVLHMHKVYSGNGAKLRRVQLGAFQAIN